MCFILWEAFWLVGPPLGLTAKDRTPYLLWGLLALTIAGFQAFLTLMRDKRRLEEEIHRLEAEAKRGNRPCLGPSDYTHGPRFQFGLFVNNQEYAAYDVHIPDAPIADSGYVLHFQGVSTQIPHKGQAFFPTWIESTRGASGYDGKELDEVMRQNNIRSIQFAIISKDSSPKPNWYRDNCIVIRDVNTYPSGLGFHRVDQEVIEAPATRPQ
jgi:hypothetical protein